MSLEPVMGADQLRFYLYRRSLHPELFDIYDQREIWRDDFRVQLWVVDVGHVITFQTHNKTLTEAILPQGQELPVQRRIARFSFSHNPQKLFRYDDGVGYDGRFRLQRIEPTDFHNLEREIHRAIVRNGFLCRLPAPAGSTPALAAMAYATHGCVLSVKTWRTVPAELSLLTTHTRWEVRF